MELKKYKLGDIADIINGATPSTSCEDNYDGEIVWITPKDLSDQKSKYIEKGSRKITQKGYDSCSTQMIPSYNILMSSRAPIGLLAINKVDCCTNQGFKNIIVNKSICDVDYLYYYLKFHIKEIEALGSGTTFKEVSKVALQKFEINIPNLEEQKRIGNLLSALDQKIALNRKINDSLEAMAKQLYDYWFVQFDFPNKEGKPYKSSGGKMVWNDKLKREIPAIFKASFLGELCCFRNGINYVKDEIGEQFEIINVRNISSSKILLDGESFDTISVPASRAGNYIVKDNDIIIARSGCPGSTRLLLSPSNILFCGFIICCTPNEPVMRSYLTYCLKQLEGTSATTSGGSILQNVSQDTLKSLCVAQPTIDVLEKFNDTISSLFTRMLNCLTENKMLIKQRDELLPLLMNGQVSVNYD